MKYRLSFALLAICISSAWTAQAATISPGVATLVTSNGTTAPSGTAGPYKLSVYDGKASFQPAGSTTSTTLGDGTLLDYRFVTSTTGSYNTYAQGTGGRISTFVSQVNPQSTYISTSVAEDSWVNLWTSNDPGTNFSSITPNYTDTQITHARANRATGTINVAGLTTGTVYFSHGFIFGTAALSVTMSGADQPNLTQSLNITGSDTNRGWITDFDFDNTGNLYDTITFTYVTNDTVTRGRFMGVMLDAIPEPSSTLLVLGSLAGFCLRRRR